MVTDFAKVIQEINEQIVSIWDLFTDIYSLKEPAAL